MTERMQQVLDNLRRQIGDSQWDDFVEACYDAFGNHDELDGENAVLFEQVQNLKRENDELRMKFVAANRKSIDLEHEVADLKAEYEGYIEPPKDEDGKYIHIGDVMECVYNGEKRQFPVSCLNMESDGWHVYLAVNDCVRQGYKPSELLHCRPDSWERIIEDARAYRLNIGGSYLWKNKSDELVARCKALCERMAGERK